MKGVRRGDRVRWSQPVPPAPGASRFARGSTVELVGVVLDRHPDSATWWVKPDGARDALPVPSRLMEPAAAMHGAR